MPSAPVLHQPMARPRRASGEMEAEMTQEQQPNANDADAYQSEHEREVAENVESAGQGGGQRPTSGEDLAADRTPGDASDDADVVGDDGSSPGQNSDRLPQ